MNAGLVAEHIPGAAGHRAWSWFTVWAGIGVVASFGVIGLLTIGLPLLIISGGTTTWLLIRHRNSRVGIWGLLSGASVAAGFLAWTNRDGPGDVCHTTLTGGQSCQGEWNPIPLAIVAGLLLVAGVVLFTIERRRMSAV